MQTVQRRWCTVLLATLRAGAGGNVSCLQIRAEMKHSTLPTAPALVRCLRMVRYGAYLFAMRRLFMRAGMHCGKVSLLCFFFRCCCAVCSVGARLENILFYRMEKAFCFFTAHNILAATQRSAQRQRKGMYYVPAFSHSPFCKTAPLTNEVKRVPCCTAPKHNASVAWPAEHYVLSLY